MNGRPVPLRGRGSRRVSEGVCAANSILNTACGVETVKETFAGVKGTFAGIQESFAGTKGTFGGMEGKVFLMRDEISLTKEEISLMRGRLPAGRGKRRSRAGKVSVAEGERKTAVVPRDKTKAPVYRRAGFFLKQKAGGFRVTAERFVVLERGEQRAEAGANSKESAGLRNRVGASVLAVNAQAAVNARLGG
jgi:hypothetical protein